MWWVEGLSGEGGKKGGEMAEWGDKGEGDSR